MDKDVSFSRLLGETAALIGDGIRPIAIFVVVMSALTAFGVMMDWSSAGRTAEIGFMLDTNRSAFGIVYQLLAMLVSIVAGYLLVAELLKTRGRLAAGGPLILAYVGLSILTALGILVGFVFLIVPGIILMVRWSAAPGFLIGSREGVIDALGKSWDATKGHSWPIFFAGLLMIVAVMAVAGGIGAAIVFSASTSVGAIVGAFAEQVGTAVSTAFTVSIYLLVSNAHDELGEVFG